MDESLHKAIVEGNLDALKSAVPPGLDINQVYGMQGTPLCAAISACQPEMVKALLAMGCDVNAADFDKEPPLCLAIRKGYRDIAAMFLETETCDVDKMDPVTGNMPLHIAIDSGDHVIVKALIDRKCDLNKRNDGCNTPLIQAIRTGNVTAAQTLLEADASLKHDLHGYSPLHIATNMESVPLVELLVDFIKRRSVHASDRQGCISIAEALTDASNIQNNTVLHTAVGKHNLDLVTLFCGIAKEHNVGIDSSNTENSTPFFMSCRDDQDDLANVLMDTGANINLTCPMKKYLQVYSETIDATPVHCAIRNDNLNLLKKLVSHGASINTPTSHKETPLYFALFRNKPDIAEYLLDIGKDHNLKIEEDPYRKSLLHAVTLCDRTELILQRLVQEYGCPADEQSDNGLTPLQNAVALDCIEVAQVLLELGANVDLHNMASTDPPGGKQFPWESPLGSALANDNSDMVTLLVNAGCDLSVSSRLQYNPHSLQHSCIRKSLFRWVASLGQTPRSLSSLSQIAIRRFFKEHHLPMKQVQELPLPQKLLDALMFRDILKNPQLTFVESECINCSGTESSLESETSSSENSSDEADQN